MWACLTSRSTNQLGFSTRKASKRFAGILVSLLRRLVAPIILIYKHCIVSRRLQIMERFLRLLFNENVDAALQNLRSRLLHVREVPLGEFVLSNGYRAHYAERSYMPVKKIAQYVYCWGSQISNREQ